MGGERCDYLVIGGLREDYCITHDGRVLLGELGGNAAYAAAGASVWGGCIGLASRVGSNFPKRWLEALAAAGFGLDRIRILPEPQDTRTFYAYLSAEERIDTNPKFHFQRAGHPLPKQLMDYLSSTEGQDQIDHFAPLAVRPEDIPEDLAGMRAAHLAPADFLTHSLVPLHLRRSGVPLITLDPSSRYMEPRFSRHLPGLIQSLDAFLPSEAEMREFFEPRQPDLWDMAAELAAMGCDFVVIKRGAAGQLAYDRKRNRRWHIPAYPARVRDVTGAGDAFCGGFMVGLDRSDDLVEACLYGSVSASLTIEGSGALHCMQAAPGLAEARLASLRPAVRPI